MHFALQGQAMSVRELANCPSLPFRSTEIAPKTTGSARVEFVAETAMALIFFVETQAL